MAGRQGCCGCWVRPLTIALRLAGSLTAALAFTALASLNVVRPVVSGLSIEGDVAVLPSPCLKAGVRVR